MPDRYTALRAFWQLPLGKSLLTAEAQLLGEALEDVFGWEFLQVGRLGRGRELLAGCRTRRKIVVAPSATSGEADIIARPSALPVGRDSVDAVLLPHTLEFASDPYAIVREVDRVLSGEGQLVVLGFQPFSLWGMRARSSRAGFPPGMRRILSAGRVREWLVLLGYEIVATRAYLHCTPWGSGAATTAEATDHSPAAAPQLVQPAARRGLDAEGPQTHPRPDPDPPAPAREAASRHRPAGEADHAAAAVR